MSIETNTVTSSTLSLIPLLPLLGALLSYLVGSYINKNMAGWIATSACALAFVLVINNFNLLNTLESGQFLSSKLFTWMAVGEYSFDFLFRFDQLTAVMCLVVTGIGTLIHLYSIGYMSEEPSSPRFFAYLNLFMFSMLLLVLGGNLLVLFVGWEGVGLCSYLLIGFWHKNISYAAAGRKAFVVNRIGDAAFLIAVFLFIQHFGTTDFVALKNLITNGTFSEELLTTIAICLFIGATGKSAQIPLFVWLPDAMAGPTPVSALIHAATMVTAGVYLTARLHFLFDLAPYAMAVVVCIAVLTAIVAASIALVQNDIKKVLAYSTVSQLGFMFVAAGSGAYWIAVFHLVTHAFFKACLFLGSGSVIHGCHHEQDMRKMGGLLKVMPVTAITYFVSTLAIAGIFPLSGYFSKHHIMESLAEAGHHNHFLMRYVGSFEIVMKIAAIMTAFYVTRSFAMTFLGKYRGHAHPHESPVTMLIPLIVLATLAAFGGLLNEQISLQKYLSTVLPTGHAVHGESIVSALIHSWPGFLGVGLALLFYTALPVVPNTLSSTLPRITKALSDKLYFDELYQLIIIKPLHKLAGILFRIFDQGIIDGSVNGTAAFIDVSGEVTRNSVTGHMRHYALCMLIGTVILIYCML